MLSNLKNYTENHLFKCLGICIEKEKLILYNIFYIKRKGDLMRVLILSATTGGGHMRAAYALKDYIKSQNPDSSVMISDTIQYISPFLNKAVTEGYVYLATKTPKLFGYVYRNADKDDTPLNKTIDLATTTVRNKLRPLIDEFKPDIIISTHTFASEIFTALKIKEGFNLPIISIMTDFAVHQTYINEGVDAYIVSSHEMINQMVERGVERVKIYPYGIPVKQEFFNSIDRQKAFESEGMNPDIPTVLIMAGSFGVTDVLKIYHKIVKSPENFQVIVITGKNEKLYETFDRYLSKITFNNSILDIEKSLRPKYLTHLSRNRKPTKPTKLMYYTDEVEKYMHMADIIVTKPGGLTVSEAIASELPMGIFKAIPGQEEQNADFLVRGHMAVRLEKDNTCTKIITDLIANPEKLKSMKQAIREFSRGNSSANIYILMKELLKKYGNEEAIDRKEEQITDK